MGAYKSAMHVVRIVHTTCSFDLNMTSQCNTPALAKQQQHDWKEAEDHELVTNSEDDEANTTAKFVEHEQREVARKVAEAEQ